MLMGLEQCHPWRIILRSRSWVKNHKIHNVVS